MATVAAFKVEEKMRLKMLYIADNYSVTYPDVCRMAFAEFIKRFEKEHGQIKPADLQPYETEKPSKTSKPPEAPKTLSNDSGILMDYLEPDK